MLDGGCGTTIQDSSLEKATAYQIRAPPEPEQGHGWYNVEVEVFVPFMQLKGQMEAAEDDAETHRANLRCLRDATFRWSWSSSGVAT